MAKQYYLTDRHVRRLQEMSGQVAALTSRAPVHRRRSHGSGDPAGAVLVAKVDSSASGGGHYNCHLQTLDATHWDSSTDPLVETGDSVVVLNLAEAGQDTHQLDAGDLITCWGQSDDEGNLRLVGVEVFGRYLAGGNAVWPT